MLRIATVNVNGIRAAQRRGFGDWLEMRDCDVIAVQEVRAQADKIPEDAFGNYHVAWRPGISRDATGSRCSRGRLRSRYAPGATDQTASRCPGSYVRSFRRDATSRSTSRMLP
jgi:exonuclease III